MKKVLTIAGSDSGGGAGIQADLKAFQALGVYGTSAITAVTAQNTRGVQDIHVLPAAFVRSQIDSVMADIGADAWKTGMLAKSGIVDVVIAKVRQYKVKNLVVDPVMRAQSGDSLVARKTRRTFLKKLFPYALVVTPNIPEAEGLTGITIASVADMKKAAGRLWRMGAKNVVLKGGHLNSSTIQQFNNSAIDILFDGKRFYEFAAPRIKTKNTHGTGCTFASAIAAELAKGKSVEKAVAIAKAYITEAIRRSIRVQIGRGNGPLIIPS